MRRLRVVNQSREQILGDRVLLARWWWQRMKGLLGHPPLRQGEGMLLRPCRAIHMYGMRFPLDVAFLDRQGRVRAIYTDLSPGDRTRRHRDAVAALELPVGTLERTGTQRGDLIRWTPT